MRAPIFRFGAWGPLACAACVAFAGSACGNGAPPAAPPSGASGAEGAEGAGAAAGAPGPTAPSDSPGTAANASSAPAGSAAPARKQRPLPINNHCTEIVTVVFGEDPKAETSGKRAIAGNSTIEGPRDAEGNMTVHLLDDKGEKVATVHVTRGMKKVDIGASCRTLDAR